MTTVCYRDGIETALHSAIEAAIVQVGIDGLKRTSFFPRNWWTPAEGLLSSE